MRPIRIVLLALLALFALFALLAAPAATPSLAQAPAPSAGAATPAAESGSALPQRSAPPRTLRAYTHVFVAFAIAWMLLFGYVVFIARKFRRVEEQLNALARS